MNPSRCCQAVPRRISIAGSVIPGALLALLPKCPACLAAYVSVTTGWGMSVADFRYARTGLLIVCLASLLYVAADLYRRFRRVGL